MSNSASPPAEPGVYLSANYIPKYHPELNPQEMLWRTMRYEETMDTYYETFEELKLSVFKRSQSWKPKKIMSLCHFIWDVNYRSYWAKRNRGWICYANGSLTELFSNSPLVG